MFSLNIIASLLAIACAQAALFTEPCIRSPAFSPLIIGGSDGLEECAIVTAPSTVLNFMCGGTLNVIEDIIWYILIDGDLSLTVAATDEFYPFTIANNDNFLVGADIIVQCAYCLSRQNCSVEFPSYISKPISIDVIGEFCNIICLPLHIIIEDSLNRSRCTKIMLVYLIELHVSINYII